MIPTKINKKILSWQDCSVHYCEYIDKDLMYHLFCNYRGKTREVYRSEGDFSWVRAGIWDRNWYYGYKPLKTFLKPEEKDLIWYDCSLKDDIPHVMIDRSFTNKKTLIKALPILKYVYPDRYDNLWTFIRLIQKYPQLELIYKNEYLKPYWQYRSLYKLNKKDLYNLAKFIECDKRYDFSKKMINNMIYLLKHPNIKTAEQWENVKWYNRAKKVNKFFDTYGGDYKDLAQYLKKQYNRVGEWSKEGMIKEYNDYLGMCEKLNIIGAFYPKNLQKGIEMLSKKVKKKKKTIPLLKEKVLKKYNDKLVKNKNLTLYIPNTLGELIKIGNKLDNCVGSYNYDEKIAKHESLIVVAMKDKEYKECCEINLKQMKINQLYGKSNTIDGKYHNLARTMINRFIREIRA